jgi:hypothetical protein
VSDDIALLRVSRDVIFSHALLPICLPFGEIFPDTQASRRPVFKRYKGIMSPD